MAEALFSYAWEKLKDYAWEKLKDYAGQELSMFADAPRELEKLSFKFQSIRAVLDDAESRQTSDESVQLWLSGLRHLAYDIEDLVEDWRISGLGDQEGYEDDGNRRKKARLSFGSAFSLWDHAVYRRNVAHDIKEIRERLDQIDVEGKRHSFSSSIQGGDDRRPVPSQRQTTSLMDESEIFIGREQDKDLMISRLVSGSSHEDGGQAHVVAIFGIGGLGKTTLAREIYNDGRVQGHFNGDLYWVCVSEVYDVIRLTKAILEQVRTSGNFPSELDTLQKEILDGLKGKSSEPDTLLKVLLKALKGKRFLLVLDDVWNDDAEKWEMLRLSLKSGAHGSRILVTTRSQKVANAMNAAFIHELKGLSDDDSWELFKSRAFARREAEEVLEFENVGKKIVNKCKGVPLSIKVIGSTMNSKRTVDDWEKILESKIWSLPQVKDKILPPLLLTYCDLPTHLKPCFVYCSMFPKDWEFEKETLIRLWVAQGFIRSEGNRDIDDIGEEYFDDLVAWSMFQQVEKYGLITCTMHDLLHELAESIAKDEIYCSDGGKSEESSSSCSNVRHAFLSFIGSYDKPSKIPIAAGRAKKLRTLWLDETVHGEISNFIDDLFHQARFLRALNLPLPVLTRRLPESIGKLKHLRYLHLADSGIVELPESIVCLRNLHTLNLTNCGKLEKLPRGIGRMVSLRHLEIEGTDNLEYLPKGLGRISGLRSLSKFIVGGGDEGEGCGMDELQPLNSLQGTLQIVHSERVSSREEAEKVELWEKQYLCSLELWKKKDPYSLLPETSEERDDDAETERIDSLLEGLRPHRNLENLRIEGLTGSKLPSWMDGMPRLRKLRLTYGPQLEWVPRLPSLKEFEISGLRIERLPEGGWEQLVALQKLIIRECRELKFLPEGLTQLPSLEDLRISDCDGLESLPVSLGHLKKLKRLDVGGSEVLTCLPDSVGQLESLESLLIGPCQKLASLPVSLGQLKKLKSLVVGGPGELRWRPGSVGSEVLTCLPDSVGQLESLESLEISYCKKLESLPVSLGQLKKLKSLMVSWSEVLRCLPDSVGQLESLESLRISNCKKLESLPVWLGQLNKLKSLEVSGSEVLTCLPDSVGQLESLESLRISLCWQLKSLPVSLGQLKKLNSLDVWSSRVLKCLPDSVGQLESLESLNIVFCWHLESLPVSLGQLKKLKSLEVGGSVLTCLPDSVGQLESLESLRICSMKLESLPVSLGQLKKLKRLDVDGSEVLACLPDSAGQLESLESLDISDCKKLESLPVSLGQLKKLKSLGVGDSEVLTCLPDSVGQLESLESLDISDCKKLESLPVSLGQLKKLKSLKVGGSEVLRERYKREGGVDWPNISHIPYIKISDMDYESSEEES